MRSLKVMSDNKEAAMHLNAYCNNEGSGISYFHSSNVCAHYIFKTFANIS